MEGADPIEDPTQLEHWVELGLRIVGPAWSRTRYSGGTWGEGGLTELGYALLKEMTRLGIILDISHMADQALEDSLGAWRGPVMASHSNARELMPAVRQIPASITAEIGTRGGVIGVALAANMLAHGRRATLDDVVDHVVHHARSAGGPEHVGLGTDLDGGFPTTNAPITKLEELQELPRLLEHHFSRAQVDGIMGENWLSFLYRSLPTSASVYSTTASS
jgi:membrane dipeptidase